VADYLTLDSSKFKNGESMSNKKIIEIDKDIADIVPGFLENRRKEIITLKDALAKGDFTTARNIGHKISGNAGSYGFDELGEIGANLETNATKKDLQRSKSNVESIEHYLANIEVKYI